MGSGIRIVADGIGPRKECEYFVFWVQGYIPSYEILRPFLELFMSAHDQNLIRVLIYRGLRSIVD